MPATPANLAAPTSTTEPIASLKAAALTVPSRFGTTNRRLQGLGLDGDERSRSRRGARSGRRLAEIRIWTLGQHRAQPSRDKAKLSSDIWAVLSWISRGRAAPRWITGRSWRRRPTELAEEKRRETRETREREEGLGKKELPPLPSSSPAAVAGGEGEETRGRRGGDKVSGG